MKVIVISSSPFVEINHSYYAYSPYAKELEIWAKYSDEIAFFCPIWKEDKGLLISKIDFPIEKIFFAKEFNLKTFKNVIASFLYSFFNFYKIFQSMLWADHIHLRCPGNIGLLGCFIQILFPNKPKTAKYAGNWDPKSKQPLSYKLQRWILSNTFLTKNMQVLVYGEWEGSSKNIKPFFTATYRDEDKAIIAPRVLKQTINFIFVGTLSEGKRPLYAVQIIEKLNKMGCKCILQLFGEGAEKQKLQKYCEENKLNAIVYFKGNQNEFIVRNAYQTSHFILLPSESEGWPKVVAEGMFWGCVPITTKVSCLGKMLDNGKRGVFFKMNINDDVSQIMTLINNQESYKSMAQQGIIWSRKYTLDLFEKEIKMLLQS